MARLGNAAGLLVKEGTLASLKMCANLWSWEEWSSQLPDRSLVVGRPA